MKSHRRNVLVVFILLFQGTFSLSQSLFWQTAGLDSFQVRNFAINAQGDIFAGASNASYGSGLYRSTNNGLTWDTLNIGFPDPRVFSVMVDPRGGIFAGVDSPSVRVDGVYYSSDDGGTWEKRSSLRVVSALMTPDSGRSYLGGTFGYSGGGVYRSVDTCRTWTQLTSSLEVEDIAITHKGTILAAGGWAPPPVLGILRSTDNGQTWTHLTVWGGDSWINQFLIPPSGDFIFEVGEWGIFASGSDGLDWFYSGGGIPPAVARASMNSLAMDSYGRLYAGSGEGGVYRSSGGASWFEWNSGLTNLSVYALIVNSKGFLFAGTLGGVFRSVNPVVGAIFSTDRSEIDFPQVPVGKSMVDSFTVYSQGSTPLYIDTATSSDTAFTVFPPRITISPGDSARFYVSFTPQSVRAYTGYIYLANNGASSPDVVTVRGDAVLGIAGENQLPKEFALAQNYPNPFNPLTVIRYTLPRSTFVSLRVYNLLGEAVATLVNELKEPGSYGVAWDGNRRSSGVYFYRIIAGEFVSTRKMIFVR